MVHIQALIDDAKCFETVRAMRRPDGVRCPECGSSDVIKDGHDDTQPYRQRYHCHGCRKRFDDLTDTIFAGHHQPLRVWVLCHYRVSTQKQGASGLGLEGQAAAVAAHAAAHEGDVLRSYTEVETGKRADRPELARALADCRRSRATLVIAKLDRLSRNARFLLALIEAGVDVAFCDLPQVPPGAVGKFLLTQIAAVAELEAGLISERTRAALAAYKARGGLLGSARPGARRLAGGANPAAARRAGEVARERADDAYADITPLVAELRANGATLQAIADRLNADGHTTRRGRAWGRMQASRVLGRVPPCPAPEAASGIDGEGLGRRGPRGREGGGMG